MSNDSTSGDLSLKFKRNRKEIKQIENRRDTALLFSLLDIVEKDVKEFIKKFKEEINLFGYEDKFEKLHWSDELELIKIIDKLAGSDLT